MASRLTHVLDEQTPEDGVRLLSLLLQHLPPSQFQQQIVLIGRTPAMLTVPESVHVSRIGRRLDLPVASAPDLHRALNQQRPDVIFTWSAGAAAAASTVQAARGTAPIVMTITDPAEADRASRWRRCIHPSQQVIDIVCSSEVVQRKLIQSGIPIEATTVIRPGIDFGAVRRAQETFRRADVGLPETGRVLLTVSPPSRSGGQFYAVWAAAILHHIWPDACMVIPGTSREQERIRRLIDTIYCPDIYFLTANRFTPAELLAISDMLIVPALDDISTAWLAWAMVASVPIVASAVPAVTEWVADNQTGFLCKPGEPHTLAMRIKAAAESTEVRCRCTETAASQAYDFFRTQRCVDEYIAIIRNRLPSHLNIQASPATAND